MLHISNVAMEIQMAYHADSNFDIDFAVQVALLHDTLSTKKEKMMDSLNRINELDKEVGMVKLADRITNLQPPPGHWGEDKVSNYLNEARMLDKMLEDKNEYLNARLKSKILEYEQHL
ncbi:hypothetical protein [Fulvivirga marina]|uniref:hypothetical protein n=1 Tax=Fulvivirga marina TaxID=2494733 RepID=UPI001EE3304D|nr:hypothetical protein [Fulvivirga marina]